MSFGRNPAAPTIKACPKCGKKNRVPAKMQVSGSFNCGSCGAVIISSAKPIPKMLFSLLIVWALVLSVIALSNSIGPETWWFGSANLYLPQLIWATPALIAIPWTFIRAPRWTIIPILLTLWVVGPLMGLVWRSSQPIAPASGIPIRVMQFNVKWAHRDKQGLADEIVREHPDIIQFQDSGGHLAGLGPVSKLLKDWNIQTSGQYITVSRFPITDATDVDISFPGKDSHHCSRMIVDVNDHQFALYNVHLLSPRLGLISVRHHNVDQMISNADSRLYEAQRLAESLRPETLPVLLTGDLNAPMQAMVCREVMGTKLRDAFQESGQGYGYSYGQYAAERVFAKFGLPNLGSPFMRIDHILYSDSFVSARCWTGSTTLSEHVPVYADLILKQ